jgi:hypothetical protein
VFGQGDVIMGDPLNQENGGRTNVGDAYANPTGIDGRILLDGAQQFTVAEIEVFQITDE